MFAAEWFGQWDFVILRGFNEFGRRDFNIDVTWRNAAGRTRRGIYGWPVPGTDNHARGRALVEQFADADFGYWADREHSGAGLATIREVEDYLRGIESTGAWGGFYSNIDECPRSLFLDAHPWWVADYDRNDGMRHDPNEQPPVPSRPWVIHQFTDHGGPDGSGLDLNFAPTLDFAGEVAPTFREEDVLYRAKSDATDRTTGITKDSVWLNAGTRFLRVDAPPVGAVILDVAGDDIAAVRADQLAIVTAARVINKPGP